MAKTDKKSSKFGKHYGEVSVRSDTLSEEDRTVQVVWTTTAAVKRYDWRERCYFMEVLSLDAGAIRMQRLETGMSLLDSHDSWSMSSRLGTVVPGSVEIDGDQALAVVRFSTSDAAEVIFQDLLAGHPIQISVGYKIHKYEKTEGDDGALPVYRAIDWEPMELSAVPVPADPNAYSRSEQEDDYECVVITKTEETGAAEAACIKETAMNKREAAKTYEGEKLDALAMGVGLHRKDDETDDAFRARLLEKFDQEDRDAADANKRASEDDTDNSSDQSGANGNDTASSGQNGITEERAQELVREAQVNERDRTNSIRQLAQRTGFDPETGFVRQAVDGSTSVENFRELLIDQVAERGSNPPTFPHIETRGMQDAQETLRAQIANAVLHRHNVVPDLMDGANEWRAMSAMDIARELLRQRGEDTRGSVHEIAQRSLMSTSDFPIIMGEISRQTLMAGYEGYANTFAPIANRNLVSDFREVKELEMGKAPDLERVNEHGEFKRGRVVESQEGYQIESYGKIIGLTRRMIINDQLGAFTRLISNWGLKAAKLEGDIVWGMIIKNAKLKNGSALFHASKGNLASSGTALDQANLEAGTIAFRKMRSIDGERIAISPNFLFTGTNLSIEAQRQTGATFTPNTVNETIAETTRAISPVFEHRLDEIAEKAWFLFASTQQTMGRGLQYCYLAGHEQPRFEDRVGFDVDGIEYKIAHDFGAGLTDYRFAYKNPGVA